MRLLRSGRGRRWLGVILVGVVVLTGAVVTAAAFLLVDDGENRYAGQVMDRHADEMAAAVTDRVTRYGETVSDVASAVGAQSDLSRDDFLHITAGLDAARLSGATNVSFVVPASTAQVAPVQRFWRSRGDPGLTLRPSPVTAEHKFPVFERAFDDVTRFAGTDLTQRPEADTALITARNSGALALSPVFRLLRDDGKAASARQFSITFATPVYAGLHSRAPDRFVGWIVMPVHGQDFLAATLTDRGHGAVQAAVAEGDAVIATAGPGRRVTDDVLIRHRALTVGQRRWELTVWPTTSLLAGTDRGMSRFTLAAGVALTVMLGIMTAVLTGSRNRALEQVDQATSALRSDIARREHVEARLREREQELRHLAFHDPLTGLANRMLFYDRLTHAVAGHARTGRHLAVLFIDLDGFKQVNDRHGHHAGDTVLRAVADRLRAGVRATDTAARFGGDEFAVILEGLTGPADARIAADRIISEVQAPIDVAGTPALVSASIGIAVGRPGANADDLIRDADTAMYEAKNSGKNRYVEAGAP